MSTKQATMTTSDFNLEKLKTKELSEHIKATIQTSGNIAVFGRRGSGKTEIAKQQIKERGAIEVYMNLSVFERVDVGGYPNVMAGIQQKKFVDFLLPQFYEPMIDGSTEVVALLDEVDKADPSLWAPLLEFTQFRSINGRKLDNLKAIIMTGNLIAEGGSRPSLPLLDRSEKYLIEADAQSWLDWAGKSGHIHPSITAFIHDNPLELFGAVDPEDRYADPSPRGWARASEILFKGEANNWDAELLNKKVSGCIGKEAGIKYSLYFEHYQQLMPMIRRIFEGEVVTHEYDALLPTKKLVACMIVCARLAAQLDEGDVNKYHNSIGSVGRFLQHVPHENLLISVRSQITLDRMAKFSIDEHPNWKPCLDMLKSSVSVIE